MHVTLLVAIAPLQQTCQMQAQESNARHMLVAIAPPRAASSESSMRANQPLQARLFMHASDTVTHLWDPAAVVGDHGCVVGGNLAREEGGVLRSDAQKILFRHACLIHLGSVCCIR